MKPLHFVRKLILIGVVTFGLNQVAFADPGPLVNPGFETGDFTGWTLSGNSGFISITNDAHSGDFAASFGAVGSQTLLAQTVVATVPGATYTVDFWLRNLAGAQAPS
ncbi:MAG: carbohydrate binding domain-containing protein, partial [Opitutaceae bacterium]